MCVCAGVCLPPPCRDGSMLVHLRAHPRDSPRRHPEASACPDDTPVFHREGPPWCVQPRAAACPWDACARPGVAGSKGSVGRGPVGPAVLGPRSLALSDAGAESEACGVRPLPQPRVRLDIRLPKTVLPPPPAVCSALRLLATALPWPWSVGSGAKPAPHAWCKPLSSWTFLPDGRIRKPFRPGNGGRGT